MLALYCIVDLIRADFGNLLLNGNELTLLSLALSFPAFFAFLVKSFPNMKTPKPQKAKAA